MPNIPPSHHTPRKPSISKRYSFGEDVDVVVGLTAAALTGDQLERASNRESSHRVSHLLKAGLGAVVAAGALGQLRREHRENQEDRGKDDLHEHERRRDSNKGRDWNRDTNQEASRAGERSLSRYALEESRRHSHDGQMKPLPAPQRSRMNEPARDERPRSVNGLASEDSHRRDDNSNQLTRHDAPPQRQKPTQRLAAAPLSRPHSQERQNGHHVHFGSDNELPHYHGNFRRHSNA